MSDDDQNSGPPGASVRQQLDELLAARDTWKAARLYLNAVDAEVNLRNDDPEIREEAHRMLFGVDLSDLNSYGRDVDKLIDEAFTTDPSGATQELLGLFGARNIAEGRYRSSWLRETMTDHDIPLPEPPEADEFPVALHETLGLESARRQWLKDATLSGELEELADISDALDEESRQEAARIQQEEDRDYNRPHPHDGPEEDGEPDIGP